MGSPQRKSHPPPAPATRTELLSGRTNGTIVNTRSRWSWAFAGLSQRTPGPARPARAASVDGAASRRTSGECWEFSENPVMFCRRAAATFPSAFRLTGPVRTLPPRVVSGRCLRPVLDREEGDMLKKFRIALTIGLGIAVLVAGGPAVAGQFKRLTRVASLAAGAQ